ncbi:MAG: hypothetical protein JXB45_10760 [Candidatus Krumholzibacteriota bacterium]|nr:hypothetical protein [Candidatus Krumholzibacteriota bacterium]
MTDRKEYFLAFCFILALAAGCGGEKMETGDLPEVMTDTNLVVNSSFEEWKSGIPRGWQIQTLQGRGKRTNYFGKSVDHVKTGKSSFYLRGTFNTQKWNVLTQRLAVRPGYELVFSADMKLQNVKQYKGQDRKVNIFVWFLDAAGNRLSDRYYADAWTDPRTGTGDWVREKKKTDIPPGARWVEVGLVNLMTGYAYFDNVSVVIQEKLEWQEKETKFIVFQWLPEKPLSPQAMKRETEMIEDFARELGIKKMEHKITYKYYPSEKVFMKNLERARYRQATHWSAKEIHTMAEFEDHEMIHLLLYDLGFPPIALAKGMVFYFRAKSQNWDLHLAAKQDVMQKKIPALYKSIPPQVFIKSDPMVLVPAWGSLVTYLINRYGMEKVVQFYQAVDKIEESGPFSAHFKTVFGADFQETDRAWRLYVLRYQSSNQSAGLPGRID